MRPRKKTPATVLPAIDPRIAAPPGRAKWCDRQGGADDLRSDVDAAGAANPPNFPPAPVALPTTVRRGVAGLPRAAGDLRAAAGRGGAGAFRAPPFRCALVFRELANTASNLANSEGKSWRWAEAVVGIGSL
jgi:hypothetical protein